jgi:hypothetical protein
MQKICKFMIRTQLPQQLHSNIRHNSLEAATVRSLLPSVNHTANVQTALLQRSATNSSPVNEVPAIVHDVLRSPGQPLERNTQEFMESRFGEDFSSVRIHDNSRAAESARQVAASAFAVGSNIVFGESQYAPRSRKGQQLLAHELVHTLQQPATSAQTLEIGATDSFAEIEADRIAGNIVNQIHDQSSPIDQTRAVGTNMLRRTPDDLVQQAHYPTAAERGQVQTILNPAQQQAATRGEAVPPVTDPEGFESEMARAMNSRIDMSLSGAQQRQSSSVILSESEIGNLADIAQPAVESFYRRYIQSSAQSPTAQQPHTAYQLRQNTHTVPTDQSEQTDNVARDWVASRMRLQGELLRRYSVLSGENARDNQLFLQVRDHIFDQRTADLRIIVRFQPGYENSRKREVFIQTHVAPNSPTQDPQDTRRNGRWEALRTLIHEMLHALVHENFRSGVSNLENLGIAVEGFAEYFARPVYENLVQRAQNQDELRASIQGTPGPFHQPPGAQSGGYQNYVDAVENIKNILGGNEENLKVAYFLGYLEYLGLSGWNEATSANRNFPGNTLGAAVLITNGGTGFRVDYGRVIFGRGGNFQLHLGGSINYLAQGERLGLGGTLSGQYSWPDFYIRGGLTAGSSASTSQPLSESIRLDLIPGVGLGARIGVVRVGADVNLLIPVVSGPVSDRVVRVTGVLGASFDL